MDAIIMPLTPSLLSKVRQDFPDLTFNKATDFSWSPETKTIFYTADESHGDALLIHELAHSVLEHQEYSRDVQLLGMETDAWQKAHAIAADYDVSLDEDVIQDHLDTYREWLHARSTCPACAATGHQTNTHTYQCVACLHEWRVNEARTCALRRYKLET